MMPVTVNESGDVLVTYRETAWQVRASLPELDWWRDHTGDHFGFRWAFVPGRAVPGYDGKPRFDAVCAEEHIDSAESCFLRDPQDLLARMRYRMGPRMAEAAFRRMSFDHVGHWGCQFDPDTHETLSA